MLPDHVHEPYMRRCFELALNGSGSVSPNPMVGCVVIAEGRIVGEGYHVRHGEAHAEVNAIAAVADERLLRRATLYVNLEPCSHFGRTSPCCDLIISKRIPRVVVGCRDPHRKVAGQGIAKLRAAGVEVVEGILEAEAEQLNEAFITSHRNGRPFVALKLAQTLDGRIATVSGESKWITGQASRTEVHRLRSRYDAVLTSADTVIADDCRLTVRRCAGRNPLRVVLDRRLRIPATAGIVDGSAETLVFTSLSMQNTEKARSFEEKGVTVLGVPEQECGLDLAAVLHALHQRNVLSVLVEGGGRLASSFVAAALLDKLYVFIAPMLFGGDALSSFASFGVKKPEQALQLDFEPPAFFGRDMLLKAYIQIGEVQ